MEYGNDINVSRVEPIGDDIRNIRQNQFPRTGYATGSSQVWLIPQKVDGARKSGDDAPSGGGVILPNPFTDVL